jgi:hypothetical protein
MTAPSPIVPDDQAIGKSTGPYSVAEAAEHLGVTARAVRRYIARGYLSADRIRTVRGSEWRVLSLDVDRTRREDLSTDAQESELAEDHPDMTADRADRTTTDNYAQAKSPAAHATESAVVLRFLDILAERDRQIAKLQAERDEIAGRCAYFQGQAEAAREAMKLIEGPKPVPAETPATSRRWWQLWRREGGAAPQKLR